MTISKAEIDFRKRKMAQRRQLVRDIQAGTAHQIQLAEFDAKYPWIARAARTRDPKAKSRPTD